MIANTRLHGAGSAVRSGPTRHDINHTRRTLGLELRRRIGDHFNTFNFVRRHLLQNVAHTGALQLRGGTSIDENQDIAVTPEADIPIDIQLDRRNRTEHIGNTARHALQVSSDRIDLPVNQVLHGESICRDDNLIRFVHRHRCRRRRRRGICQYWDGGAQRRHHPYPSRARDHDCKWPDGTQFKGRAVYAAARLDPWLTRGTEPRMRRTDDPCRQAPSNMATARVQPAEAPRILHGKHAIMNPVDGKDSRL